MYLGESLVDKIFEEGIKNAQAVIVVVSKNSVEKPDAPKGIGDQPSTPHGVVWTERRKSRARRKDNDE